VGPSKVVDVDPAVLDPDTRPGWGNEPSGWVPGFALGGRWRKETGAGQGVEIERCRVLDASGCAAVCANVCKGPTQDFFTLGVGLPLTMVPDFERRSCSFIFGATPPPLEEDPVFQQACLASCALISAPSSSGAEDARRWVERDVEERLQVDAQTQTRARTHTHTHRRTHTPRHGEIPRRRRRRPSTPPPPLPLPLPPPPPPRIPRRRPNHRRRRARDWCSARDFGLV